MKWGGVGPVFIDFLLDPFWSTLHHVLSCKQLISFMKTTDYIILLKQLIYFSGTLYTTLHTWLHLYLIAYVQPMRPSRFWKNIAVIFRFHYYLLYRPLPVTDYQARIYKGF